MVFASLLNWSFKHKDDHISFVFDNPKRRCINSWFANHLTTSLF
jgi:hypothetical protein